MAKINEKQAKEIRDTIKSCETEEEKKSYLMAILGY